MNGGFIGRSPIFNPPIIMPVCHVIQHFVSIANINFVKVFLYAFRHIILSPIFDLIRYFLSKSLN